MVAGIMTTDWYGHNDNSATWPGPNIGCDTCDVECWFSITCAVADVVAVGSGIFEDAYNSAERNRQIQEGRMFLFSKLGAVVGYDVKYWSHPPALLPRALAISLPVTTCRSGYMSQHRGRHANRSIKSGRWY